VTNSTKSRPRHRTKAVGASRATYASPRVTRALLADSLPARNERLASADMISTDEAAVLARTTRATIDAWIDKGRCIGLTQTVRGSLLPRWQFETRMWDALPKLTAALNTRDGWALVSFLESPNGALNGMTPRAAIEQGQEARVLQVAEAEGFG